MSFILDALRKSETERQQQGAAEFTSVPTSTDKRNPTRWLWMLAALLGINLAVLFGILMRPDAAPDLPTAVDPSLVSEPIQKLEPIPAEELPTFAAQVAQAKQRQPSFDDVPDSVPARANIATPPRSSSPAARIATIDELRLDGSLQLAELHIDIHVYSDKPEERFVFINMVKHRERSRLAEGPTVEEITPDGVILEHEGRTFLLPRE